MTTEPPLLDLAVGSAVKRQAHVFEFDYRDNCFGGKNFVGVLIELGEPQEGLVISLVSQWLDSAAAADLTEYGKEIVQEALLRFGDVPSE